MAHLIQIFFCTGKNTWLTFTIYKKVVKEKFCFPEIVDMEAVFPCLLALLSCSSPPYVSNSILNSISFFLINLDRFVTKTGNFILTLNYSLNVVEVSVSISDNYKFYVLS